jgi:hypothetical protein
MPYATTKLESTDSKDYFFEKIKKYSLHIKKIYILLMN